MTIYDQVAHETHSTQHTLNQFPWENRTAYADWLSQTYHFVSYSTRLLALAAGMATLDQQLYHEQFGGHLAEEQGHEKIALSDLKNLRETLRIERPQTQIFRETPRLTILKVGPAGLVGYMHFLESLAVLSGPQLTQRLSELYGPSCARFVRVHATEDVAHIEKTNQALSRLTNTDLELIGTGIQTASQQYNKILQAIRQESTLQIAG